MFAILEKRIVAGIVASLSLVANLAVFVFLGVVGPIILNVTSISMMVVTKISKFIKNFKIDLFVKMHRQLPLLLFTPGCPTSSTPPMLSFSYPGVTIISLDTNAVLYHSVLLQDLTDNIISPLPSMVNRMSLTYKSLTGSVCPVSY